MTPITGTGNRRAAALGVALVLAACTIGAGAGAADAATSKALLGCQTAIESQVRGFTSMAIARISNCTEKVVQCKLADEIDAVAPAACLASAGAYCSTVDAKVDDQQAKRIANIVKKCGLTPLADLEQFVGGLGFFNVVSACGAATVTQLATCIVDDARCGLERAIFRLDPRAQDSLSDPAIDVAGSFPCVAP